LPKFGLESSQWPPGVPHPTLPVENKHIEPMGLDYMAEKV